MLNQCQMFGVHKLNVMDDHVRDWAKVRYDEAMINC